MKIGKIEVIKGILLAPMEDVTDLPFRVICKRLGADIVYSEFIASEGIVRNSKKSIEKMRIAEEERPMGIQIFGHNDYNMAESARIVEDAGPDILDINYGCWVKKVVQRNAGAAMLKDPEAMAEMTRRVVESSALPVTVKTRLGWSMNDMAILEVAPMLEQAGAKALALHCRTRDQGMGGDVQWDYINRIKELISIPVILNGDVKTAADVKRAFETTNADAVMIGRGAIGNPFIFRRAKEYLATGIMPQETSVHERVEVCLAHLELNIEYNGYPKGMIEFRKHYSGYLKGLYNSSKVKQQLVVSDSLDEIKRLLQEYVDFLDKEGRTIPLENELNPEFVLAAQTT